MILFSFNNIINFILDYSNQINILTISRESSKLLQLKKFVLLKFKKFDIKNLNL